MTDELTPHEKELLKGLPRERMPVGLEGRVVEAMREHGFLAKRRRAIVITNSRVAGLLAACVALMIGAYSIGLHRGGGDQVIPAVTKVERDYRGSVNGRGDVADKKAASTDEATEAERVVENEASVAKRATTQDMETVEPPAPRKNQTAQQTAPSGMATERPATTPESRALEPAAPQAHEMAGGMTNNVQEAERPMATATGERGVAVPAVEAPAATNSAPTGSDAADADRGRQTEATQERLPKNGTTTQDVRVVPTEEKSAPQTATEKRAGRAQPLSSDELLPSEPRRLGTTKTGEPTKGITTYELQNGSVFHDEPSTPESLAKRSLTFLMNGTPVVVEADSVRVVRGERGRILIIYTVDGVFRIPLADDD